MDLVALGAALIGVGVALYIALRSRRLDQDQSMASFPFPIIEPPLEPFDPAMLGAPLPPETLPMTADGRSIETAPLAATDRLRTFAQAIAFAEGFGRPGAVPTRANNPGDLKLSGYPTLAQVEGKGFGTDHGEVSVFPSPTVGWQKLYRQLTIIAKGRSAHYVLGMSIVDMGDIWTGRAAGLTWARNVAAYLVDHGYPATTTHDVIDFWIL